MRQFRKHAVAWRTVARTIAIGVTALALTSLFEPACPADILSVTVLPDGSEIITTDLKRIRPAGPAEIRFRFTTDYLKRLYGNDFTKTHEYLHFVVQSSERRALGAMTGAQATGPDGPRAVMAEVDREVSELGLAVEQYTLRYEFLPGYTP
jgi:hypothetical protein